MTFAIGGAVVAIHNDWSTVLAAFVSAIGWVALAEGVLLLAFRERFISTFAGMARMDSLITLFGVLTTGAGIVLLFLVFGS